MSEEEFQIFVKTYNTNINFTKTNKNKKLTYINETYDYI